MPTHATALFADRHAAHAAVEQLVQAGFPRDAISVMMSEQTHEREFGAPPSDRSGVRPARHTGVLGAIVAGVVALVAPDGPALRAAGPLVGALVRDGGTECALPAALIGAGLPELEARFIHEGVRRGSIVVSVHASGDRSKLALQLLELSGGSAVRQAA
jgi:hypothetical protein